jgi:ABC-type proline/glycine betaine transport system permease subunit
MTGPETATPREPHSAAAHGPETVEQWPTLFSRMFEDFSRVVQLELQLLEARMARSLTALADRAIAALIILYAGVVAGCCLLTALILLLHEWMQWWQCFAIGGLVAIACGVAVYLGVTTSLAPGRNEERLSARAAITEDTDPRR